MKQDGQYVNGRNCPFPVFSLLVKKREVPGFSNAKSREKSFRQLKRIPDICRF